MLLEFHTIVNHARNINPVSIIKILKLLKCSSLEKTGYPGFSISFTHYRWRRDNEPQKAVSLWMICVLLFLKRLI